MTHWAEDYKCGCVSKTVPSKNLLLGYCAVHGEDRRVMWSEELPREEEDDS